MTISEGQSLPEAKLMHKTADGIADRSVAEITKGRSVVIFGLPGAYTGTCSTAHVPSFIRTFAAFKAKGVDEIARMLSGEQITDAARDAARALISG